MTTKQINTILKINKEYKLQLPTTFECSSVKEYESTHGKFASAYSIIHKKLCIIEHELILLSNIMISILGKKKKNKKMDIDEYNQILELINNEYKCNITLTCKDTELITKIIKKICKNKKKVDRYRKVVAKIMTLINELIENNND